MKNLLKYEGGSFAYSIFISFVKEVLGPHMEMDFIDEDFYFDLWSDFYFKQNTATEIHRGAGKTEFLVWVGVYDAVFQPLNRFSNKKITQHLIVSSDVTSTTEINQRIRNFFFSVPELTNFLPLGVKRGRKNDRWNNQVLEFRNGSTIFFRPVKTKRGLHVDRISIDDPTTESSTLTDSQTINFIMGAILPMGTVKNAIISFTGTPLRMTDIFSYLSKTETFEHKKFPAYNEEGKVLSKKFTREMLEEKKSTMGSAKFACEYLLNPIDDSVSLIKRDWVLQCFDDGFIENRHEYDAIYLGVDFAFSDRVNADYSAFVEVGVKKEGNSTEYHILKYRREKGLSVTRQMEIIALMYAYRKYDMIALEENSIKSVSADIKEMGLPIKMFWTGNRDEKDLQSKENYKVTKSRSISKINAINRLAINFENLRFKIPYNTEHQKISAEIMLNELISWSLEEGKLVEIGVHPDGPMALIMAMSLLESDQVMVV